MTDEQRQTILDLLCTAYNMELETVCNYLSQSINPDGIRAKHIKDALAEDIQEELGHATLLAKRIKVLEGTVPGSQALKMTQDGMQPTGDPLDVVSVIKGVIVAEEGAIAHYQKIIDATGDIDPVTEDLAITLKGDEEEHRRLFKGFLAEAQAG
ncbi:MAG: ferritin-like domain-containing protein [Phycisphaerales bacterium JB063]